MTGMPGRGIARRRWDRGPGPGPRGGPGRFRPRLKPPGDGAAIAPGRRRCTAANIAYSGAMAVPQVRIKRDALVARCLAGNTPVVVIDGWAGSGKSWLLEDIAGATGLTVHRGPAPPPPAPLALWDVPSTLRVGGLPDDPPPGTRLLLARRPGTAVPGLARAQVYGRVRRIRPETLCFSTSDLAAVSASPAVLFARTGGWACLLAVAPEGGEALASFLKEEVLAPLPSPRIAAFEALLDGTGPMPPDLLRDLPFVDAEAPRPPHAVLAAIRPVLLAAIRALLSERRGDSEEARAIGMAQAALGRLPQAIATFQSITAWHAAVAALRRAGGPFYLHRFGTDALDRALAGFPPDLLQEDETLVLCRAMQAVKRGEVPLTRRILLDRFGEGAADAVAMLADRQRFSVEARFFRLLFTTWEDFDLDTQYLDAAYDLLAELPAEDDLSRGSLYNALLEVYMRTRRFAEAEHAAIRAAEHYEQAGVPLLSFYIDLHRGIIALFLGDPDAARLHARAAAANLGAAPFESAGDMRLLNLLEACIAYESGESEPLARFLSLDLDGLLKGEIWPSLVEFALIYGSQALAEHFSVIAAQGFLDRWRVTQERASQFRRLIDLREAIVLQNSNRWQEAAARAAELQSRITPAFLQEASPGQMRLADRDEVTLALFWLRQMAWESPATPGLEDQIRAMLGNPHLTARQRIGAEIWLAHVLRRSRRTAEAQAQLAATLTRAARAGTLAILSEERSFIASLTATRRERDALERADAVRRMLRQLQEIGPGRARRGRSHGLTRQETRVLQALAEGAPNKAIANRLGLSEATIKFHLKNLYRKLGCTSRREAIKAALALRLVS